MPRRRAESSTVRRARRSTRGRGGRSADFKFTIGIHIDGLSVTLLFVVAFISTLIQIYSLEYVRGDRRFTHFFAALTLFTAGMLCMVVAENTVQLSSAGRSWACARSC